MTKHVCRAITPPSKEACGKPARFRVVFKDEDSVLACQPCALYLQQVAQEHRTNVKVEALDG
jgi:hypothetical protein